jgi:hypothetical protein
MKKRPEGAGLNLGHHSQFAAMTPPPGDRRRRNLRPSLSAESPDANSTGDGAESIVLAHAASRERIASNRW